MLFSVTIIIYTSIIIIIIVRDSRTTDCVDLLPVDGRRQKRLPRWGRGRDPRAVTAHG